MSRSSDDELDARIAALSRPAPDAALLARTHARARAAFVAAAPAAIAIPNTAPRSRNRDRVWGRWATLWNRALEPLIVSGIIAGYIGWTAAAMGALHRARRAESPTGVSRPADSDPILRRHEPHR